MDVRCSTGRVADNLKTLFVARLSWALITRSWTGVLVYQAIEGTTVGAPGDNSVDIASLLVFHIGTFVSLAQRYRPVLRHWLILA